MPAKLAAACLALAVALPAAAAVPGKPAEAAVAADLMNALYKNWKPDQMFSQLKRVAQAYAAALEEMPEGMGAAEAAGVRYWIENAHMPPGSKNSWHNRLSFMGAVVSGGEIRYSFARYYDGGKDSFQSCWANIRVTTDYEKTLLSASAEKSCSDSRED